jgi:hypothetical protein
MATRGVKVKAGEDLSDSSVKRVIEFLEAEKPITKKEACKMLNISYNTTRLNNIIEGYKDRVAMTKRLKAKKRGTPVAPLELEGIILDYLKGTSIVDLAKRNYRSTLFIKGIIEKYNVPPRAKASSYFRPEMLPEEVLKEDYEPGEMCWSSRYNTLASIDKEVQYNKEHGKVYRIWTYGKNSQYACQPWYELGSLTHLEDEGINVRQAASQMDYE